MENEIKDECPDCGCPVSRHNAVNKIGDEMFAHCADCGSCWKSTPEFTEQVRAAIELANGQDASKQ